ncbi:hypothetical protein Aph02nite_91960 [Actinoplanes philippinensis]|uniref:Uncharacterized protein n=1 Tax=Actinoplanes philippinensis TaxID=35752 RepID=A0A1I2MSX5_9ACTN|nr:hypothetical protein [Actinoplanes philippinensis]GIE83246.1 hypothetical protein Aph02nite_91960 [Actinoplanes philippinensis]SFF94218.1 hypothetical protein SAMN05421541_13319 [Actinoplanes philippinensis]
MPRADESPESVPGWLLWPIRAVAIVVVLPFRLLGMALTAIGRFLHRYLLVPLGRLWHHAIVIPATWLWRWLIVVPATWLWRCLIVVPATWLWVTVLRPPARWLGKALLTLLGWLMAIPVLLIGVPATWLWEHAVVPGARLLHEWVLRPVAVFLWTWILAPLGRGTVWFLRLGWQGTTWLFRQIYRFLLRPIGIAAAMTWRYTFGALWRHIVAPTGRWLRDEIIRPTGAAIRSLFSALS